MLGDNSYKKSATPAKFLCPAGLAALTCLWLFACGQSDLGTKYSRDPVTAGAFGKSQEDMLSSLLQKYVNENSQVNYSAWHASSGDTAALQEILSAMGRADTRAMSTHELKSLYINAYNTMTIDLVLSHYEETLGGPTSPYPNSRSIRNIGNLDDKVWDNFHWKLGGQSVSLNDIENRQLRPLGDARIHFAIVCASKGCPPIPNRAFSPSTVEHTLDQLADAFVNSGRNTEFKVARSQIRTSHILEWFSSDFERTFGSAKAFFFRYIKVLPADQIKDFTISYMPYDWTLNEPDPGAGLMEGGQ